MSMWLAVVVGLVCGYFGVSWISRMFYGVRAWRRMRGTAYADFLKSRDALLEYFASDDPDFVTTDTIKDGLSVTTMKIEDQIRIGSCDS